MQLQQQELMLLRVFETVKPAVVRVYAVFPSHQHYTGAGSSNEAAQRAAQDPQQQEHLHFLGSGFFFDHRGEAKHQGRTVVY